MPRKKDRFCEHVTFLDDKGSKWKCTFCREEFSGGGTRIKAHLANAERYGIRKCESVDDQVRTQAWDALCGKRVQDPDGADKRSISPHHHSINTAVPDDAHRPMNHQPTSSEVCFALLYQCPDESSGAEVDEVQPQAQMYDGSSTHQGLGQQPPNVQQTNTEFQVPQVKMRRKRDIDFCQYVKMFEDEKRTKRMCTFCDHEFAGGGTRIKAHLAKAKGHGIVECEKVSEEVRVGMHFAVNKCRVEMVQGTRTYRNIIIR